MIICILFLLLWHKDPSMYPCKWQLHDPQRMNPTVFVPISTSVVKFPQWLYYRLLRFDSRVALYNYCTIDALLLFFGTNVCVEVCICPVVALKIKLKWS